MDYNRRKEKIHLIGCEYDENDHNMTWINANFKYARKFSRENDPFRIVEKINNEKFFNKQPLIYDYLIHSILKILPNDTYLSFSFSYAKNHKNTNGGFALKYELEPMEFQLKCDKVLRKFKSLSDFILEGTKLSCMPLEKAWDVSKCL